MLSSTSAIQTMPTCTVRTARPGASRPRAVQVVAGAQQPNKTLQGLAGGLAAVTLLLSNPGAGLAATDLQSLKGVGATEIPAESNEFPARPIVPAPPYCPDNNAQGPCPDQAQPSAPKKATKSWLGLFTGNNNKATKQTDTLQARTEDAADNAAGSLKRTANSAASNTKQAANSLKQGSGNSVTGAAADAAASVKGAALDTANKAKSAVQGTSLDRAAGKAESAKNSLVNAVQGAGDDVADKAADAKDSLVQKTKNILSGNPVSSAAGAKNSVVNAVQGAGSDAADKAADAKDSLLQNTKNLFSGSASDKAADAKDSVVNAVQGADDRTASKAAGAKSGVINAVQEAGSEVADKVGDAKESLVQNTKNLFSGNAGGATEQASSTADAVKQGARDLKDGTFNAIDRAGDKLMEGPKRVGQEVNRQVQKKNIQAVPASAGKLTQEVAREQGILGENYQGPAVSKEEAMDRGEKYLR